MVVRTEIVQILSNLLLGLINLPPRATFVQTPFLFAIFGKFSESFPMVMKKFKKTKIIIYYVYVSKFGTFIFKIVFFCVTIVT